MGFNTFDFFTIKEIETPTEGSLVLLNNWWALTKDNKVIIMNKISIQGNKNENFVKKMSENNYSGNIVFIPIAYIPDGCY